jgi:beta-catenin-like protein 1
MSKRPASAITNSAAAASSSRSTGAAQSSEESAKRVKFDDLVSGLASEFTGVKSAVPGLAIGYVEPERKSADRMDLEQDDEPAPRHLTAEEEMDAILKLVEEAPDVPELDLSGARLILVRFSKAVQKNSELRTRYADDPMKFMESEIALDEACSALTSLSSSPAFYPLLLEEHAGERTIDTLCTLLLSHENIDVSIDALKLLHELIDAEELSTGDEELEPFIAHITDIFPTTIVRALARFPNEHEKNFADAVTHILAIIENLTDLQPKEVSEKLVQSSTIVEWIMQRLKQDSFNANKLYASEVLSILLTNVGVSGQEKLGKEVMKGAGMKNLIKYIAKYRKADPSNDEETEYVENLFDILCLSLHNHLENQQRFAAHDGIQLMLTMIRRNTYAKSAAFKAIDYGVLGCTKNCETLIDESGLKSIFGQYMFNPTTKKERADQTANELHLLEIISQLFLHTTDVRYLRLRRKFEEQGFIKVDRTVELLVKYQTRVDDAEAKHRSEKNGAGGAAAAASSSSTAEDDVSVYDRQTDHGLTHVEQASIILAFLATSGDAPLRSRVEQNLHQQDLALKDLSKTLTRYVSMMGETTEAANAEQERQKAILSALASMLVE